MRTSFSAHPEVKKYIKAVFMALGMVALTAAVAAAAEQGGGEGATTMDWVWRVLDTAVIAVLLVWIWVKYGKPALAGRIAVIEANLADAKLAREQALARLAEVEAKLKDKDAELKGILQVAQANGEKERELLIKEAEEMTADLAASAKELIEAELVKAKEAIRREAALKAVELAEKMIKENVKKEDQTRMLQEYLEKVGS